MKISGVLPLILSLAGAAWAAPTVQADIQDDEQRALAGEPGALARKASKAIRQKDLAALEAVLRAGFDPDTRIANDDGVELPLLVSAAQEGFLAAVELLAARGANVNQPARGPLMEGLTPLLAAVRSFHFFGAPSAAICRLLLRHQPSADPNAEWNGSNALWLASEFWGAELFEILLERGAYPNRPRNGWTLLMRHAKRGDAKSVKLLLEYQADPELRARDGRKALAVAQDERSKVQDDPRAAAVFDEVIALLRPKTTEPAR